MTDIDALWLAVEQSPFDLDRWRVLADALNDAGGRRNWEDEQDIRVAINAGKPPFAVLRWRIQRQCDEEEKRVSERIKEFNARLVAIEAICPHERTRYHADPSGNNDWYDECLDCGKEGKRL